MDNAMVGNLYEVLVRVKNIFKILEGKNVLSFHHHLHVPSFFPAMLRLASSLTECG